MNINTYYSILQSLLSPEEAVKLCKAAGYDKLIICDKNSMSGVVQFYSACKKAEIKPILGTCLKVCECDSTDKGPHNIMYDLYLLAKNKVGYTNLLKIIDKANDHERVLDTPYQRIARVNLEDIKGMTDGIVCLQGAEGTELYSHKEYQEYTLSKYRRVFSEVVFQTDIAWSDVHYHLPEHKEDFHILLCILLKCKLVELADKIYKELPELSRFVSEQDFSIPSKEKRDSGYSQEILDRTESFLSSFEDYEILSKPKVPRFDCPDGMSQQEYLTELCRLGWKRRFPKWESEAKKKIYADRVKYELEVLQGCGLDGYLLVVQDYVNWAKRQGWFVGPGRGSAGGCLVAYLLGITEVDPIIYNLLFERFYSEDRGAGGVITLPDIDIDFPRNKRQELIEYVENKYGRDRVFHITTFGTLKGSGALTEVLRAHDVFPYTKIKSITKNIPSQDKISDKMQEQEETSVLNYTLKNLPKLMSELAYYEGDEIVGEQAYYVKQAIRIEGCVKSYGTHASGILISDSPTREIAPLIIEAKGPNKQCALDMGDAEASSLVKVDILGVKNLDILMETCELLLGTSEDQ